MKTALLLMLIVPGMACLYALILRPLLHKIPALQKLYAEADGFWAKVWAMCGKSVTVAWVYIMGGVGSALALIDPIASSLGDPDLKTQVTVMLQSNPKYIGYFTITVSLITLAARLRSIAKA